MKPGQKKAEIRELKSEVRNSRNFCVRFSLLCVLISFGATIHVFGQATIDDQRRELYQTREQLEQVERRLSDLRYRRSVAERSIQEDDQRLATINNLNYEIQVAQREKEATIVRIRRAMYDIQGQIEQRRQELAERLVAMYKYGRVFELDALLSARTMPDVYKKLFYMRVLAEADKARMDELGQLQADMRAQQDHFKYAAAALRQIQDDYDRKRRQIEADKQLKSAAVSNTRHEEVVKEAQAEQLAAAAAELENLIKRLEATQPSGSGSEQSTISGRVPWPVSGRVKVGYGEQTSGAYGTATRNSGIVIECTAGSPVRAVAKGRVSYAEEFMTYGNLVILDHGDGSFSVYGDLQDIAVAVNDAIAEGDVVGHANAGLYFELRKAGGPVDPMSYLR
jgi:murein hydrolase activator